MPQKTYTRAEVKKLIRDLDKKLDDMLVPAPKVVKPRSTKRPGSK